MHNGQQKREKPALVGKTAGAISKLRTNNAELVAALALKKKECEELKLENLELKNQLQTSEQRCIATNTTMNKMRSLLQQISLSVMSTGDGVYELCRELDENLNQQNSNTDTSSTITTGAEKFKKLYYGRDELMAIAAGNNLSIIVERSSLVDESPQPSGSGMQALVTTDTKGKALIPLPPISEKLDHTNETKTSKVVAVKVKGLKMKSILHKAKKVKQAKPRKKLNVPLPVEEMPAFKPKFQIPRTPTRDVPAVKEVTQSTPKIRTAICNLERLIISSKENILASSSPKNVASPARAQAVAFEDKKTNFGGESNSTYQKTPIPAGVLMQNANDVKSPARSPIRSLPSSVPFSLDESITPSDDPFVLQDVAGPSNGVDAATKVKKPQKKVRNQAMKKLSNQSNNVQTKTRAAKRKSRKNTLIDEETVESQSPKVTPSPKKMKPLEKTPTTAEQTGRRVRSAVSYKEPSLSRKMRRT